jgi:hypothetical protein
MRLLLAGVLAALTIAMPVGRSSGTSVAGALALQAPSEYVIVAAGDIACGNAPFGKASPDRCQYDETAELTSGRRIEEVLPLGDLQYNEGEYRKFVRYYGKWWGVSKENQSPVPGNHDHAFEPNRKPRGYFRYFGNRVKGPNGWGYYSYDLPAGCVAGDEVCWHLIALNSELCYATGGCNRPDDPTDVGVGEQMWRWLRRDLNKHPDSDQPCTLAYFHHPLFSFSSASRGGVAVRPLWRLLYDAEADVVLNGHSHNYQRWMPQSPDGELQAARGIREFIVGTGGASKYAMQSADPPANLAKAQAGSFGVLRLIIGADGYRWSWRTADGQRRFRDARSTAVACA